MADIVSFFAGDLLTTLSGRKVTLSPDTTKTNPTLTITFDISDKVYMGSEGGYTATGDEIVLKNDKSSLSLDEPEISFTSKDATTIFLNIRWQIDGKKVNHGESFIKQDGKK